jgi:hypothetical protein
MARISSRSSHELHELGVPDKVIQAILRHVSTTQRSYIKTVPEVVTNALSVTPTIAIGGNEGDRDFSSTIILLSHRQPHRFH